MDDYEAARAAITELRDRVGFLWTTVRRLAIARIREEEIAKAGGGRLAELLVAIIDRAGPVQLREMATVRDKVTEATRECFSGLRDAESAYRPVRRAVESANARVGVQCDAGTLTWYEAALCEPFALTMMLDSPSSVSDETYLMRLREAEFDADRFQKYVSLALQELTRAEAQHAPPADDPRGIGESRGESPKKITIPKTGDIDKLRRCAEAVATGDSPSFRDACIAIFGESEHERLKKVRAKHPQAWEALLGERMGKAKKSAE